MTSKKVEHFTDEQMRIAKITKALGHPARIAILQYLLKVQQCICGDIVDELPLAQSTVSQHLKVLKDAELIKGSIEGTSICYCIEESTLIDLKLYFKNLVVPAIKESCC